MSNLIPIGSGTVFGKVVGVISIGERYYFLENESSISLMPATVVEKRQPPGEPERG